MFLLFSQNKIADEIASIFWVYHTALCTTDPTHFGRFTFKDYIMIFIWFERATKCWFAIKKPIPGRFNKIITSQGAIVIY